MEEVYLAYFDFLGFKEFIENNEDDVLKRRMENIFRDVEIALGQGKYKEPLNGIVLSDISTSTINCLNISDTVLFWTNQCDLESLKELIKVSYDFNWRQNSFNFPVRGAIIKGKIHLVSGQENNDNNGSYSVQCLYGKGLIKAHNKAESQNWAGTVVDESIISDLIKYDNGTNFLKQYAIQYQVPYKNSEELDKEFVLKLAKNISNDLALKNTKESIIDIFKLDNKTISHASVQMKIENTLKFIDVLRE